MEDNSRNMKLDLFLSDELEYREKWFKRFKYTLKNPNDSETIINETNFDLAGLFPKYKMLGKKSKIYLIEGENVSKLVYSILAFCSYSNSKIIDKRIFDPDIITILRKVHPKTFEISNMLYPRSLPGYISISCIYIAMMLSLPISVAYKYNLSVLEKLLELGIGSDEYYITNGILKHYRENYSEDYQHNYQEMITKIEMI